MWLPLPCEMDERLSARVFLVAAVAIKHVLFASRSRRGDEADASDLSDRPDLSDGSDKQPWSKPFPSPYVGGYSAIPPSLRISNSTLLAEPRTLPAG